MRLKRERQAVADSRKMTAEPAQDERYELPDGWVWVRLGDVVSVGSTQVLPNRTPEQHFNYLALEHVEAGTGRIINFSPTLGGILPRPWACASSTI